MKSEDYTFPKFDLADSLPWLKDVSLWSSPTSEARADSRDAFLLAGDGYISARLGVRERVSTLERIMAPHLSSYNFGENANFFLDTVRPSRDFYPPISFVPTSSHVWHVRNAAIIITAERDDSFELITVNAVHAELHSIIRYASLRNLTKRTISDVGISFEALPDIPFAIAGERSAHESLSSTTILETLDEQRTVMIGEYPRNIEEHERYRYLLRGIVDGKRRGLLDLYQRTETLGPGAQIESVHYLCPALTESRDAAIASGERTNKEIERRGIAHIFQEVYDYWQTSHSASAAIGTSEPVYSELIENNLLLQKSVERATGGFVVIDDYTGSWLRDHNGPHRVMLNFGHHDTVRKSMDRYYGLDRSRGALLSVYPSDYEPSDPLPDEPDWEKVEHFVAGDVPTFRAMWYWWYFQHTGDLAIVRERFEYMLGAFMRQRLHENNYLANYCFDETYGIGPVGPMRKGLSCDNSFIALRAGQILAHFADLLVDPRAAFLANYRDKIHQAVDKTFWLSRKKYYAMRVTPEGKIDHTPLSIGLLRPLWSGALAGDDPRGSASARYAFEHLYHKNGFIRLIPSHDQTVTMAIGYMLTALKKMGHPGIDRAVKDMLKWADASGTFGEYLDEKTSGPHQCYEHLAHRSRMWESGLNTDALLQTLFGFEPDAYSNSTKFAPYLPASWKEAHANGLRVGQTKVSITIERAIKSRQVIIGAMEGVAISSTIQLLSRSATKAKLDGTPIDLAWTKNAFGMHRATVTVTLEPGVQHLIDY